MKRKIDWGRVEMLLSKYFTMTGTPQHARDVFWEEMIQMARFRRHWGVR